MEIEISNFSKKIKELREDREYTQEALARELGISRQSIISIEQGRCLPSLPLALEIAQFFNESLENILNCNFTMNRKEAIMPKDITPWSPLRELSSLHEAIDDLFEENLPSATKTSIMLPLVNVYDEADKVVVRAEIPGVKEENLSIEVSDDQITIRGEKKAEKEVSEKNYYRKETSFGSFARVIALPSGIDKEKAEADLKDGVLNIYLPKVEQLEKKVTKIKVKTK